MPMPQPTAIAQAVATHGAHNVRRICSAADQGNARLGEYEFQLMLHAIFKPT